MHILICTDDSPSAEQAANLITRFNFPPALDLTLLAVSESTGDQSKIMTSLNKLKDIMGGARPGLNILIRHGHPAEQIIKEASSHTYDLVAVGIGEHHRSLLHLRSETTLNKLARDLHIPLILARNVPEHLNNILFCTSAENTSLDTLRQGGKMISNISARVGLLHVMSQLALNLASRSEDLLETAESAMQHQTREGIHLTDGIQVLHNAGVTCEIIPRLRHGLVLNQVLAEINAGNYNLLVIGTHFRPGLDRWMEVLLDDVTSQLITQSPCSVLIA